MIRRFGLRFGLRIGLLVVCLSVLALVFLAYLRPDMAVDLANRLWSCF